MGFLDLEKMVHLVAEEITEEEKESLFVDIVSSEVETNIGAKDAVKLFQITREVLKFKGDQVESLILELDNLAVKLGEEEAKRSRNYVDDVDLRASEDEKGNKNDMDDYNRKLVKMEIQNNRLIDELQEKEQELMNEKKELEKLTSRISVLEEENKALRSELQATQQELASTASLKSLADDQDYPSMEKYHELTDLLRQKNKHITQLLNDIEDTEKENIALKDKLSDVRDELGEGAEQMSKLSMERLSLSTYVDELKYSVLKLEQENAGLRNQISELVADKEKRDQQFERTSADYELKIQQWKDILQKRDTELMSLRLQNTSNPSNRMFDDTEHLAYLSDLSKTLAEREEKIVELQQQLEQATVDLNENTRLLEEQRERYKSKFERNIESSLVKQLKKKLEQTENRIGVLEAKAKHAEEDSLRKAEEVTELIIQLREYESGTYGLEEAMIRIKEVQKQKEVRDTQIEQLVQNSNQLQDDVSFLEQENRILRDRLGISPSQQIVVDDFSRKNHDRHNKLVELMEQLEKCQDELLSYRLENRNLSKQISSLQADVNYFRLKESSPFDSDDNEQSSELGIVTTKNPSVAIQSSLDEQFSNVNTTLEDQLRDIVDENESLRKGMQEILDSIRNRDGSGIIQIESETLERLLEALDTRHVTGWYQPAMRLQAYIHNLSGVNKTLREELHVYRQREEELLYELHDAGQKLEQIKGTPSNLKIVTPSTVQERKVFSPKLKKSVSCVEDVMKSSHLVEKELKDEKQKCRRLEDEIKLLHEKFAAVEDEATKLRDRYETDKESWLNVKTAMQKEIDDAKNTEQILQVKNTEYEKSLEVLKQGPDDIKKAFAESTFGISILRVEQTQLSRKLQALLDVEYQVRQERNKLSDAMHSLKVSKDREIVGLRNTTEQLSTELKNQLMTLSECVNRRDHDRVVNDFNELTVKHRELLHKQILIRSEQDQVMLKLQKEVASLLSQKTESEALLKVAVEENKYLKFVTSDVPASDQVTALTKQLASFEVEIINKKQYSDHLNRMYELTKVQLTETESRCKHLENQLLSSVHTNSELQKNEAMLKERILRLPNITEFEELTKKLQEAESEAASLRSQKTELEELANIAQDQVKALEQYNRYQDFEYDSLQRRILELQSLSDEKMVIDRLTKELLLLQQNGISANRETNNFKDKLAKSESEMLQAKLKLSVCEDNYIKLKRDSNLKIRCMCAILYELQKRYLGSFPLVKEELCFESLLQSKEECYSMTSLLLELKPSSIFDIDESENDQSEYTRGAKEKYKSKFKIQDFNMRLINEGLHNKIQIYAERLERQDKLISRLEQEIIHADEQCQEFLLYWSPHSGLKLSGESEDIPNSKFTQTLDREVKLREEEVESKVTVPVGEPGDELNQTRKAIEELHQKLRSTEDELRGTRDRLANLMMELKEKELMISNKDREISNLQGIGYELGSVADGGENNDEDSTKGLALKATVDSLQNIIDQKEEIIKRLQTVMKKNGEEHAQSVVQLLRELKVLQDAVDAKEQACTRLKARLDAVEKPPNEKRAIIDAYLTKIHELEDELNQSNEKVEQLSGQLTSSNQQAELWSHTAEERLKTLQNMKHELDTKQNLTASATSDANKISYTSLLQIVKDKSEEIERQNQMIEELKVQKRLGSGEKLPGYRDRLKNELERHKRKVELLEQRDREDKAEIQRLKNQILTRPQSARKKDTLVTPKEEQLLKKVKTLEEQIEAHTEKEKKWTENRRTKIDSEVEKWQNKKRYQQNQDKLRQQLKETTMQNESLKIVNDRLKETVMRLEKERMALDSKLKAAKSQTANLSLIEELQMTNNRLEREMKVLRNSIELSGATSLTDVIEAQERKIKVLEVAQKGDCALAEEVERLNERKSQLQKYNVHLEEVNMRLKLNLERLKSQSKSMDELSDSSARVSKTDAKSYQEDMENQLKGNRRKNIDLEKAVLVLRRVVEKLQAENKRLHGSKVAQLQDKSYVEKLQIELQNLQENYLDAIEKASVLDKELKSSHEKIDSLQKLINRLQNGEEMTGLKSQLTQKNRLLSKVKVLLEKAAIREKELIEKVHDLQATGPNY